MGDEVSKPAFDGEVVGHDDHPSAFSVTRFEPFRACSGGQALSQTSPATATFPRRHSLGRTGEKARNLFIFDWDDTLLCSSALRSSSPSPPPEVLADIAGAAEALLLTALSLGETIIITNGTESWVNDSASRFLPGLVKSLAGIQSISARARHEQYFPEDPFAWKRQAFQELLSDRHAEMSSPARRRAGSDVGTDTNLIVVGDSWYEIEAARSTLGLSVGPMTVKTLKLKEAPSAQELLGQMRRLTLELPRISTVTGNSSWILGAKPLPHGLDNLLCCASSWDMQLDRSWSPSSTPTTSPLSSTSASTTTSTKSFLTSPLPATLLPPPVKAPGLRTVEFHHHSNYSYEDQIRDERPKGPPLFDRHYYDTSTRLSPTLLPPPMPGAERVGYRGEQMPGPGYPPVATTTTGRRPYGWVY
mmetsp:Transcript_16751/g.36004  ORF Transcript_16751/g.36004 Transcript_16751/m.36004 type:complete len:417 (-) Transcript_16751:377-1627(-)